MISSGCKKINSKMKAKLIFTLPEEQDEYKHAINGADYFAKIDQFDRLLRSHQKHNSNPEWDTDTVKVIREELWEIFGDLGEQ